MSLMVLHWLDSEGRPGAEMFDYEQISVTEASAMAVSVNLWPQALCRAAECDHERR